MSGCTLLSGPCMSTSGTRHVKQQKGDHTTSALVSSAWWGSELLHAFVCGFYVMQMHFNMLTHSDKPDWRWSVQGHFACSTVY